ncbi:DUF4381 domain-containing protein [Pseudidiomarina salilacus]|uniref:DUF4381 domain-containing protein n=1 Tax=Pseudidiomarina salilacus TaxID=3384452 RepID=UPI003984885F
MTPTDPRLQDMQDIIAAPAASWWPLAPGWYVLAVSILTLVLVTSWMLYRRHQQRRMQRAALQQLKQLTATASIAELTHLLKQTTQGYFPNYALVSLPTAQWHQFLLQQLSNSAQARYAELLDEIAAQAYQDPARQDAQPLSELQQRYYQFVKHWLKHALPPSKQALKEASHD